MDGGDRPQVPVAHPGPGGGGQPAVVAPGHDPVPEPGVAVVVQHPHPARRAVGRWQLGLGAGVERGHGGVVGGDQHRRLPGGGGGAPGLVGVFDHGFGGAVVEAAVGGVGVQGSGVAAAQPAGGVGFPPVAEPPQQGQLGGAGVAGEQPERAAGVDRAELVVVPDEQQLRAGRPGLGGEVVQGEGAGQRRLVDDHQLPGPQPPRPGRCRRRPVGVVSVRLVSCCHLATVSQAIPTADAQLRGGCRGRGEPDHRGGAVGGFPAGADGAQGAGLPGPGRADQHVDAPPGGERPRPPRRPGPRAGHAAAGGLRGGGVGAGSGGVGGGGQQPGLGVEDRGGGVRGLVAGG